MPPNLKVVYLKSPLFVNEVLLTRNEETWRVTGYWFWYRISIVIEVLEHITDCILYESFVKINVFIDLKKEDGNLTFVLRLEPRSQDFRIQILTLIPIPVQLDHSVPSREPFYS